MDQVETRCSSVVSVGVPFHGAPGLTWTHMGLVPQLLRGSLPVPQGTAETSSLPKQLGDRPHPLR